MKQSPSERQFEYLRSIGAWNDGRPAIIPAQEKKSHVSIGDTISRLKWWWFALLCGAVLLVLATVAHSNNLAQGETNKSADIKTEFALTDSAKSVDSTNLAVQTLSSQNDSTSVLMTDTIVIVLTLLLIFGAASGLAWWFLKRLITAVQRIAISVMPLPVDTPHSEHSLLYTSTVPKDHIHRLPKSDIPSPDQVLQTLSDFAQNSPLISHTPLKPSWSWSLGYATHTGNVRKENQDYVTCFRVGEYDVLICADGLGGLPKGQQASFLAVFEAAKSALQELGSKSSWRSIRLEKVLRKTLSQAHHILSTHGDKLRITNINGGLRTTLIIVLAKGTEVHYGYIGDGALDILRTSGTMDSLMIPQKHGQLLNVLSASLGPQCQGEAVTGQVQRTPGDLIIVSTDGIADRVDAPAFARDIMRTAIRNNGDLHAVAQQVVEELASSKDEHGYICDDNLSLALLGTGQTPLLGSGFWNDSTSVADSSILDESDCDKSDVKPVDTERVSS